MEIYEYNTVSDKNRRISAAGIEFSEITDFKINNFIKNPLKGGNPAKFKNKVVPIILYTEERNMIEEVLLIRKKERNLIIISNIHP